MQKRAEKQLDGFLNTPALWENEFQGIQQFLLPPQPEAKTLNPLENLPSLQHNFVLGKRMESFFELLLKHSENYKILAANTQLFREKITIGELDFLLKNTQEKTASHVEMVYKFYCYDPSFQEENQRWIGPNRRDTLIKKVEKLRQQQFPLLFAPEARELLKNFNLEAKDLKQFSCFKANLFLPKAPTTPDFTIINKNCVAGYWLPYSQFLQSGNEEHEFHLPRKQDWPVAPRHGETWLSYREIIPEIENSLIRKKSPLVWMKTANQKYERFFIVWW